MKVSLALAFSCLIQKANAKLPFFFCSFYILVIVLSELTCALSINLAYILHLHFLTCQRSIVFISVLVTGFSVGEIMISSPAEVVSLLML